MYRASTVVAVSNEYALTENFYDNLFEIINDDIEVITVMDGECDRKTEKFMEELESLHSNLKVVFNSENQGYSKANNRGAFMSEAPYLIFINSDTFPIGDSMYKLIDYMDANPDVGVAQGMALYPQSNKVQSAGHVFGFFQNEHAFEGRDQSDEIVNKTAERQALSSRFYITRRDLFFKVKGFDEVFYNAWEGLEYSVKIHFMGYKCMYYPEAKAYHVQGSGRGRRFRDENYQRAYFWSKWGNSLVMDLTDVYKSQLKKEDYGFEYLLVNGSSLRTNIWEIMLNDVPLKTVDEYYIERSESKKTISLEDSIPNSVLTDDTDALFLTDRFSEVTGNHRIFTRRKAAGCHDIILDLHGNVMYP